MRLIDADALHETLKTKQKWVVRCGDKHNEGYTYDQVHFAIDDAPTVDIVRCGECIFASDNGTYGCMCEHFYNNDYNYHRMYADDFCSYGEREGEQ